LKLVLNLINIILKPNTDKNIINIKKQKYKLIFLIKEKEKILTKKFTLKGIFKKNKINSHSKLLKLKKYNTGIIKSINIT
jgi:hypothetical protein